MHGARVLGGQTRGPIRSGKERGRTRSAVAQWALLHGGVSFGEQQQTTVAKKVELQSQTDAPSQGNIFLVYADGSSPNRLVRI